MKEGNVKEMVDNLISTYVKFCFRLLTKLLRCVVFDLCVFDHAGDPLITYKFPQWLVWTRMFFKMCIEKVTDLKIFRRVWTGP